MIYSPHLCAIVVLIGPTCLELRASPSFRKCCIWDSTKLSYTKLVFESVQITKTRNMSIAYTQGFLEGHCDDTVKGAIELNVRTPSLLSSELGLLFIPNNGCHPSKTSHQMSQCIFEDWSPLAFARVCNVYNRGPMHNIVTFPNWEGRRHQP